MEVSGDDFSLPTLELGTHALVAPSSRRKKGSRKRWFARVALLDSIHEKGNSASLFLDADVPVSTCRASGPGGQHVNKTASAVRALHRPSGIIVRVESERSQHANRAQAMERIREELQRRAVSAGRAAQHRLRHEHCRVERGNPVRTYVLSKKGQLEVIDD